MQTTYPLFTALPLAAAFFNLLVTKINKRFADYIAFLAAGTLAVLAVLTAFEQPFAYRVGGFPAPWGILLVSDGLSSLMLVIVNVIAFLSIIYSIKYMTMYTAKPKYYSLFLLMLAGMNGVVITGDLFNIYVFLEIASIASYALVGFGCEHEELEASFKYLVLGSVASTTILFGIAFLYSMTGTLNMPDLARQIEIIGINKAVALVIAMFLMGFGLKASAVPFHAWLPDAHPSAPAPISAMLSGVLIKALGVYVLIRLFFNVFSEMPVFSEVFLVLGTLSMIAGVFLALGQWDVKRLLAYHSISQIGYIIIGVGLGTTLGLLGAIFHLLNHAIFKALLFLNAGSLEMALGTRDLRQMGKVSKALPVTSFTSMVASLSISGIPPFNGFFSKLIIFIAAIQVGRPVVAFLAGLGSLLTLGSFMKVQRYGFHGEKTVSADKAKVGWGMQSAMIVLAILCLATSVLVIPGIREVTLDPVVEVIMNKTGYIIRVLGR